MARITGPLTRKFAHPIVRVNDAPPLFLAAAPVSTVHQSELRPTTRAPSIAAVRAWQRARYLETAAGGMLAGLAAVLAISALPAPDPAGFGVSALARSLLWLGAAGAVSGGLIGGCLAAAATDAGGRAASRGLLAGLWGAWVGGLAALLVPLLGYKLWETIGWAGTVVAFPAGPLAMGPVVWIAAGTLWAAALGLLLPAAPGRPGGSPGRAGLLAGIAGFAGSATAALTGLVAPAIMLVAAAIGVASMAGRAS